MKMKVSEYISQFLVENGITDCFMVTGGGAMHLDDALGHQEGLHCTFNHHEQACAIAAEAYTRMTGKLAAVCVTSGPGGTNAITGVVGLARFYSYVHYIRASKARDYSMVLCRIGIASVRRSGI